MSDRSDDRAFPGRLWLRLGVVWVLLMALLGITLATSYLRLGGSGAILQLGIAGLQVLLIWLLFMILLSVF